MPSPRELKRQKKRRKQVHRQRFLRARNVSARSAVKTAVGKARSAIEAGDTETVESALRTAQSQLDSVARKGILHKRNAARRLSRLVRQQRAAQAG